MSAITTTQLLRNIQKADAPKTIVEGIESISLKATLKSLVAHSGDSVEQLARKMDVSRVFLYQILNETRRPGRDTLLKLGRVLRLSVAEMQRILALSGHGMLYPRIRRDAAVVYAFSHAMTLEETDEFLIAIDEQPLINPIKSGREEPRETL